jgi:hypothetical protein
MYFGLYGGHFYRESLPGLVLKRKITSVLFGIGIAIKMAAEKPKKSNET